MKKTYTAKDVLKGKFNNMNMISDEDIKNAKMESESMKGFDEKEFIKKSMQEAKKLKSKNHVTKTKRKG